ncbi:NAD(P)-dependent dehydrogenase (short-subunit alcohol dehydrogenase family) [Novosphingobium sp. PhB55]|uniref:oxidoreductase n=1 Tax=Novosphingobium sp. PhB55 TaxID=2485106 RepID=UPI001064CB90|nr:oxidoreductase [Novosphingobium sp. PhB55]TDW68677.1 NAD(P)-dependent dehydrogenase (short-subunit alcohol dehydrogenase family) [Novosphingobium sp. PhB55]
MKGFTAASVAGQAGKCFLVTGANTGLGFEATRVLAVHGARVLMACRNEEKARLAMEHIRMDVPGANLAFVPLDQADLFSVRECAEQVARDEPRLDVLVNNAGVMVPPLERTVQGHELQFGVNHLAPFALTGLLLPKLAETPGGRVVITASLAHGRGRIDWDDLDARHSYKARQRYGDSKLANLLHMFELERRLRAAGSPVSAYACHPGIASTDLGRHSLAFRALFPIAGAVLNTAEEGAWPTLQAATDPAAEPGQYYGPQRFGGMSGPSGIARRNAAARDPQAARRLWEVSVQMTGIDCGLAGL